MNDFEEMGWKPMPRVKVRIFWEFGGSPFLCHLDIWELTIHRSEVRQDSDQTGKKKICPTQLLWGFDFGDYRKKRGKKSHRSESWEDHPLLGKTAQSSMMLKWPNDFYHVTPTHQRHLGWCLSLFENRHEKDKDKKEILNNNKKRKYAQTKLQIQKTIWRKWWDRK